MGRRDTFRKAEILDQQPVQVAARLRLEVKDSGYRPLGIGVKQQNFETPLGEAPRERNDGGGFADAPPLIRDY